MPLEYVLRIDETVGNVDKQKCVQNPASKIEFFVKLVNEFQPRTYFAKSSILIFGKVPNTLLERLKCLKRFRATCSANKLEENRAMSIDVLLVSILLTLSFFNTLHMQL